jgi:cytochrome P450 enzyme
VSFEPFAPGFDVDPHPALRALREAHPVYYWEPGRVWLVTRGDDCAAVLRDPRFGCAVSSWRFADSLPSTPVDAYYNEGLMTLVPSAHLRIRKLMGPPLSPRALERQRAAIGAIVAELLDPLDGRASFDIARDLSPLLPVRVISQILGVPRTHEAQFRAYAQAIVAGILPMQRQQLSADAISALHAGHALVLALIEERRGALGADLLSELIRVEEAGDRLNSGELAMIVRSLLIAGSETTTHLLNFAALNLLRHPAQRALALASPERMERAIDEVVRFDFQGRLGNPRFSLEPVEIGGVKIPAGEMVMPLLAAALRDPRRFPNPDVFDVERDQRSNLAFGNGPHYCAGASLARIESQIALCALFERHAELRLAGEPRYAFHPALRNMVSLPVRAS